jgi:hypothetical protein
MAKYSAGIIGIRNYFGRMAISSVPSVKPHLSQFGNTSFFYKVNSFSIIL